MEFPLLLLETRLENEAVGLAVKWAEISHTCSQAGTCWTRAGLPRQDIHCRETLYSLGRLTPESSSRADPMGPVILPKL